MMRFDGESHFDERRRELERRFHADADVIARAAGEAIADEARKLAAARIEHPSVFGGYIDSIEVFPEPPTPDSVSVVVKPTVPHAPYVEAGRPPGQPVTKAYVNNAQNRRLGRVGGSYVSHYTGMPPSGIFDDAEPDWARRSKIARDGFAGRWIFRDLAARVSLPLILERVRRELRIALFGR